MKTTLKRILPAVAAGGVLVLATAGVASAHVTVTPATAAPGSYPTLTFKVPTESDNASTTKLAVYFPTKTPLASVSVQPHPGWHYALSTTKLATPLTTDDGQVSQIVSRIVWTADSRAAAIKPGEFDAFNISAGPLPDGGTLTFKVLQTYSDGSIVRWIDESQPGQPEPEHPAPTLTIAAGDTPAADTPATAAGSETTASSATSSSDGTSRAALVLSIVALVVAGIGATAGVLRRR